MSEQQFTIESERINTTYSVRILKDDEVIFEISNWNNLGEMHKTECENIVALLNEKETRIDLLEKGILDCLFEDKSIGMFALEMGLVDNG